MSSSPGADQLPSCSGQMELPAYYPLSSRNADGDSTSHGDSDGSSTVDLSDTDIESNLDGAGTESEDSSNDSVSDSTSDSDSMRSGNEISIVDKLSPQKFQAQILLSCFLRNKLSAACGVDIINTMKQMFPESPDIQNLRLDSVLQSAGTCNIKEVHYCHLCYTLFPSDPDEFRCPKPGCEGTRYAGGISDQTKKSRSARGCFMFGDVGMQLKFLLESPGKFI